MSRDTHMFAHVILHTTTWHIKKMAQGGAQNLTVNVNALSNAFAVALQQASTTGGTSTQSLTSNLQAPVPPSTRA